jgi:amino acid permease
MIKNLKDLLPLLICILVGLFCFACCTSNTNICDNLPEGENSVICAVTRSANVSPENLSKTLIVTNFAALEADVYTAREAMDFVLKAEAGLLEAQKLNKTLTYGDVVNYLITEYSGVSQRAQAVFTVVDPLSSLVSMDAQMPQILSDFDIDLLLRHLSKQKAIINLYL